MQVGIRSASFWTGVFVIVASAVGVPQTVLAASPTFSKEVAPILFAKCAECHRPGSIAPMSLLTYRGAPIPTSAHLPTTRA